jgi:hypothetical protein
MLLAGVDKAFRDLFVGHSSGDMDMHYLKPSDEDIHRAMGRFTEWFDREVVSANVDQNVDQNEKKGLADSLTP